MFIFISKFDVLMVHPFVAKITLCKLSRVCRSEISHLLDHLLDPLMSQEAYHSQGSTVCGPSKVNEGSCTKGIEAKPLEGGG